MADPHTPGPTAATVVATAAGKPVGRLEIRQTQLKCCYAEGQWSYLVVRDEERKVVAWREFQGGEIGAPATGLTVTAPAGGYRVESFQRPCDANCDYVDPPGDRCRTHVLIEAGKTARLVVTFTPDGGCLFYDVPLQPVTRPAGR